jgi:hypothetical protein
MVVTELGLQSLNWHDERRQASGTLAEGHFQCHRLWRKTHGMWKSNRDPTEDSQPCGFDGPVSWDAHRAALPRSPLWTLLVPRVSIGTQEPAC